MGDSYGCLATHVDLPCLRCRSARPGCPDGTARSVLGGDAAALPGGGRPRRGEREERTLPTVRVLGKSMTPRGGARDLPPVSRRPRLESAWMSLEAPTPGFEDTSPGCRASGRAGEQLPPSPIAELGGRNAGLLVAPATEHRRRRRAWSRGGRGGGGSICLNSLCSSAPH